LGDEITPEAIRVTGDLEEKTKKEEETTERQRNTGSEN
jgi:hypothetical protein